MENATIRNVCLVSPKIVNDVYLPSAYIDKAIVRGTKEIFLFSGGIAGYAAGCTIENCFVYNPQYNESIACDYKTKATRYYPIVGKSTSNTTTTNSAQVYKATSGSNMSFAENSIASTDGFIYSGSRYYKESAAVALRYTGAAASAANTLTFTDGSGNALNLSGSGNPYTLTMPARNITVNAALVANELTLANAADNSSAIANAATACANGKTYNVTLADRTLAKDGYWNTLCLPFPLTADQVTALLGTNGTLLEMDTDGDHSGHKTGLAADGTLYLFFKNASTIEAGQPYIIKWTDGDDLVSPVFTGVTVGNSSAAPVTAANSGYQSVEFRGAYSPVTLAAGNQSCLYLGAASTLYWPTASMTIGACRAYFHVDLTGPVNTVRAFRLGFGDGSDENGVEEISTPLSTRRGAGGEAYYSLDGRKVDGVGAGPVPARLRKGIFIVNGKKVVIK